jgi:hypothetical protein
LEVVGIQFVGKMRGNERENDCTEQREFLGVAIPHD